MRSWGRGVIGTDEMCLLNDALNQWFLTWGDFVPSREHFTKSRESFDCHHWAQGVLLVPSGWRPRMLLKVLDTQENSHNKELSDPKCYQCQF